MKQASPNKDLLNSLKSKQVTIKTIEKEIAALEKKLIDNCPTKIGDKVRVTGYAYTGKSMLVDRITISHNYGTSNYSFSGPVLRADDTPGKLRGTSHLEIK